jgi:hypothetical protein
MFSGMKIVAIIGLLMAPICVGRPQRTAPSGATPFVTMGFAATTTELDGGVALIDGGVGPNSLFQDIRAIESTNGKTFVKDHKEIRFFPGRLSIRIYISGPIALKNKKPTLRSFDSKFMSGLRFKAQWKRGMELRPVKELRELNASQVKTHSGIDRWIYELAVEDFEVPLTDHLIIEIASSEDKRLARISAHLEVPMVEAPLSK